MDLADLLKRKQEAGSLAHQANSSAPAGVKATKVPDSWHLEPAALDREFEARAVFGRAAEVPGIGLGLVPRPPLNSVQMPANAVSDWCFERAGALRTARARRGPRHS